MRGSCDSCPHPHRARGLLPSIFLSSFPPSVSEPRGKASQLSAAKNLQPLYNAAGGRRGCGCPGTSATSTLILFGSQYPAPHRVLRRKKVHHPLTRLRGPGGELTVMTLWTSSNRSRLLVSGVQTVSSQLPFSSQLPVSSRPQVSSRPKLPPVPLQRGVAHLRPQRRRMLPDWPQRPPA